MFFRRVKSDRTVFAGFDAKKKHFVDVNPVLTKNIPLSQKRSVPCKIQCKGEFFSDNGENPHWKS